jgi:hypothetical protein
MLYENWFVLFWGCGHSFFNIALVPAVRYTTLAKLCMGLRQAWCRYHLAAFEHGKKVSTKHS